MASNKNSNGGGGYEILKNLKLGIDKEHVKEYIPGDQISGLTKQQAEDLTVQGVIGKRGSFKKQQAEAELLEQSGGGNVEDVIDLVKELKNEIQVLKVENKDLGERLAKK